MPPTDLDMFIKKVRDARELKRAIAVHMSMLGYTHTQIMPVLNVSSGFISKWTQIYAQKGVNGLRLAYRGSQGFLTVEQRHETITWLQRQRLWDLDALEHYLLQQYAVRFKSKQSYYNLFKAAGIRWKRTQDVTLPSSSLRQSHSEEA